MFTMLHFQNRKTNLHKTGLAALLTATALVAPAFAQSLPTGGTVAAGDAAIGPQTNGSITINQGSANAVINWQSFNIGAGNSVNFVQPGASSAILNRVTGATTTSIAGQLNANGQVYLINPNGIAITATGTVNSGAFVASTLGISDDAFMAGQRTFTGNGASRSVTNAGTITIDRGGYLALIGGSVANSGTITVPMGRAALGSGEQATLDLSGDGFLQVAIPTGAQGSDALVSNSGTISANGGMVQLSAAAARDVARQAVNMSGTVEARGVSGQSGDITLFGGEGKVVVSGRVDASNSQGKGGSVKVASREIELASAGIDASGTTGGGIIRIGGERQGGGTLPHAETLSVDAGTTINADATTSGNGGDVVLWSDNFTRFAGTISARGGALSGNGGQAEVSGKATLAYTGFTNLSAANGAFGTLLLDPYNVTISSGAGSNASGFTATGENSVINVTTLQTALSGANVEISTGSGGTQAGNITVADAIAWTAGTMLTLNAANDISVNAPITFGGTAGAGLTLNAAHALAINTAIIVRGAGDVTLGYDASSTDNLSFGLTGSGFAGSLTYLSSSGSALTAGAGGTLRMNGGAYALLYTMDQIDGIDANRWGNYALAGNLDMTGLLYNDPLIVQNFRGNLTGLGHAISNLTQIGPEAVLMVWNYGTVRDIGMVGGRSEGASATGLLFGNYGTITQSYSSRDVVGSFYGNGGLVHSNYWSGVITRSFATGSVSSLFTAGGLVVSNEGSILLSYATGNVSVGNNAQWQFAGGLVAYSSSGTISQSYATGNVSAGNAHIGGLIGRSQFTNIIQAHASGSVTGGVGSQYIGGLIGLEDTSNGSVIITQSYATGNVSGPNSTYVGGLVGYGASNVTQSYATGSVSGSDYIGGLFGYSAAGGISQSYATGSVVGAQYVGGLVGFSHQSTRIRETYASGSVTGITYVGGLVGYLDGDDANAQIMRSYASGSVSGSDSVGGLIGHSEFAMTVGSYASGKVTGAVNVGGLVGWLEGNGDDGSAVFTSHWDIDSTGQANGVGGGSGWAVISGLTTVQARQPSSYTGSLWGKEGFDFTNVWYQSGDMRPILRSEAATPVNGVTAITNLHQLALVGANLSGSYVLASNIDASATTGADAAGIWSTAGFVPLGDFSNKFSGSFDGQGHVITGLTINRPTTDYVGLLSYSVGAIRNVGLVGASVSGGSYVGSLVGYNTDGSVIQSYATGSVSGSGDIVGGLVGHNVRGALTNSHASASVTGINHVGGLVGRNTAGTISQSFATGNVSGTSDIGGLVGFDSIGTITQSYATGNVSGDNAVGGLVGYTSIGTITQTYATGSVSGVTYVGGLIGGEGVAVITSSFWNTDTSGQAVGVGSGASAGAPGLTTAQMQNPFTFIDSGWNFASVWATPKAGGAPVLRGLTNDPIYNYYIRMAGDTIATYGDTVGTSGIGLTGVGTGNVNVGWGSAISGTTNVGLYAYADSNVLALSYSAGVAGDYYVDYGTGALTINRRVLTVAASAVTKAYGDANPALTYTATGLVNGDMLTGSLWTTIGQFSNVGAYGISGSFTASANYDLSYVGADLTVTQRAITVTADPLTRRYGLANPALSYRIGGAGLVNGDALYGSLATAAGDQSEPGAYAITQGSLLASSNYSLNFLAGTLMVESVAPGPGTLASGNASAYGTGPFAQTYPPSPATTPGPDGSRVLIADPGFEGTVICLDSGGGCMTLPAQANP
jgi:filamentous hemagglutinin family protein